MILNLKTGKTLTEIPKINTALFSPDSKYIISLSGKNAQVWDTLTGKSISPPMRHNYILKLAWTIDGKWILTQSSNQKVIRVWDIKTGKSICRPMNHNFEIEDVFNSLDGLRLVTVSKMDRNFQRRILHIWDLETGELITNSFKIGYFYSISFSQDSKYLLVSDEKQIITPSGLIEFETTIRVYNMKTGKLNFLPLRPKRCKSFASFNRNNKWFVCAHTRETARVYDTSSGKPISSPLRHDDIIESAVFSPNGRLIATTSGDNTARVWNAENGKPISTPMKHSDNVNSVSFSADSEWVITASDDYTAHVWEAKTGKAISKPLKHRNSLYYASFNKDKKLALTISSDRTLRIWDSKTGNPVSPYLPHDDHIYASFSPDERWILTSGKMEILYKLPTLDDSPVENILLKTLVYIGAQLDSTNNIRALSMEEWKDKKRKLEELECTHKRK